MSEVNCLTSADQFEPFDRIYQWRGNDPVCEDDDGYVVADYEGGMRLTVNLGPVERTVGRQVLKPYGYVLDCVP